MRYLLNFVKFTVLHVSLIFRILRMCWFLNVALLNITSLSLKLSNTILLNLILDAYSSLETIVKPFPFFSIPNFYICFRSRQLCRAAPGTGSFSENGRKFFQSLALCCVRKCKIILHKFHCCI